MELLGWVGGDLADGSVAVGFQFADGWLTIYNALDENGIAFGGIAPEYRLWRRRAHRRRTRSYGHDRRPVPVDHGGRTPSDCATAA